MIDPETPLPNAQHSGLFNKMKQFLSFDNQLNLLKSRHLVIKSLEQAKSILMSENYYRLSGYFKMFTKNDSNDFVDGFSMKKLYMIYSFDACLRHLISEYVSKIEINSRTRIAYVLAKMTSPISYLDSSNFVDHSYHSNFINKIREELVRNRRNPIVAHHSGQQMPIWALVEYLHLAPFPKCFQT